MGVVGGRPKREGIRVYIQLTHAAGQQKLTQYCKAIIIQGGKKLLKPTFVSPALL